MGKIDLTKYHTRELLAMLNRSRKNNGSCCIGDSGMGPCISADEIKDELATREHIPNKAEAKKIRQQKQQEKKQR